MKCMECRVWPIWFCCGTISIGSGKFSIRFEFTLKWEKKQKLLIFCVFTAFTFRFHLQFLSNISQWRTSWHMCQFTSVCSTTMDWDMKYEEKRKENWGILWIFSAKCGMTFDWSKANTRQYRIPIVTQRNYMLEIGMNFVGRCLLPPSSFRLRTIAFQQFSVGWSSLKWNVFATFRFHQSVNEFDNASPITGKVNMYLSVDNKTKDATVLRPKRLDINNNRRNATTKNKDHFAGN